MHATLDLYNLITAGQSVHVCVCVCVREKERGREKERERERDWKREKCSTLRGLLYDAQVVVSLLTTDAPCYFLC